MKICKFFIFDIITCFFLKIEIKENKLSFILILIRPTSQDNDKGLRGGGWCPAQK